MPKNAEDVKMMQEKDAKIKDLEEKCKKLVSLMCQLFNLQIQLIEI